MSPSVSRPTWVEIALPRLAANCRAVKQLLVEKTNHVWPLAPPAQLMAVVKADAYGHGAARCAPVLAEAGADWFAVALIEEAVELRAAGIAQPIFCLGGAWPEQAAEVIQHQLTPALFTLEAAAALQQAASQALGQPLKVHLKVDTGMGRYGVPLADLPAFLDALKPFDRLQIDGLMTHLANADDVDHAHTNRQIATYRTAEKMLVARGHHITWRHLANSAATHGHLTGSNLVRVGALLYGLTGDVLQPRLPAVNVKPVLSLHSRIAFLKTVPAGATIGYGATFVTQRTSRIATIPIGYADGYRRDLSKGGAVLVGGQRAPLVGRVSMDLTTIDVTDIPAAAFGDEVILLGAQGREAISAEDLARQLDTVSYEIVTGISARVPHVYRTA